MPVPTRRPQGPAGHLPPRAPGRPRDVIAKYDVTGSSAIPEAGHGQGWGRDRGGLRRALLLEDLRLPRGVPGRAGRQGRAHAQVARAGIGRPVRLRDGPARDPPGAPRAPAAPPRAPAGPVAAHAGRRDSRAAPRARGSRPSGPTSPRGRRRSVADVGLACDAQGADAAHAEAAAPRHRGRRPRGVPRRPRAHAHRQPRPPRPRPAARHRDEGRWARGRGAGRPRLARRRTGVCPGPRQGPPGAPHRAAGRGGRPSARLPGGLSWGQSRPVDPPWPTP